MDIWGLCEICDRWFYCASDPPWVCPVCAQEPVRVENRAGVDGAVASGSG